jgi:hypothetical protein
VLLVVVGSIGTCPRRHQIWLPPPRWIALQDGEASCVEGKSTPHKGSFY